MSGGDELAWPLSLAFPDASFQSAALAPGALARRVSAMRCIQAQHAARAAARSRLLAPAWLAVAVAPCRAASSGANAADDPALLAEVREMLLDPERLLRAVATSKAAREPPLRRRLELRPLRLKAGVRLGAEALVGVQSFASNHGFDDDGAASFVDAALRERFDSWRVEARHATLALQRNRRGELVAARSGPPRIPPRAASGAAAQSHDRVKPRLLSPDDPLLLALGISSPDGVVKASKADKFIQVEEFLRLLSDALDDALATGRVPQPSREQPLRLVDLGCGNAFLTFAAYALLSQRRGLQLRVAGVDAKAQARVRNTALAEQLGWAQDVSFVEGTIAGAAQGLVDGADIVVALHACDTATDDALAAGVRWRAPLLLAAPCCQHALQVQMRARGAEAAPFPSLERHGLLRERLGDVLTDALRAAVLRLLGYRVETLEFVAGEHTPRNVLLRAARTGAPATAAAWAEYDATCAAWGVAPPLAAALAPEMAAARAKALSSKASATNETE